MQPAPKARRCCDGFMPEVTFGGQPSPRMSPTAGVRGAPNNGCMSTFARQYQVTKGVHTWKASRLIVGGAGRGGAPASGEPGSPRPPPILTGGGSFEKER